MIQSIYIKNILDLLLDSDEIGKSIRPQIDHLVDNNYNYTDNGVFVTFAYDDKINLLKQDNDDLVIDGVKITNIDETLEARAILFLKNGLIDYLEIWAITDNYPKSNLNNYVLTQDWTNSTNRRIIVDNK